MSTRWCAKPALVPLPPFISGTRVAVSVLALLTLLLSGCGGRTDGSAGSNGLSTLTTVSAEAAGLQCAAGGSKISAGLDANANGMLDASEVSSEQYVCHGAAGASGAAGAAGAAGSSGRASLVAMTAEAAGANCAAGGTKISAGLDADGNTVLDASEVSTTGYVCQGASGAVGAAGAAGAAGANGAAGSNGLSSLIAIVAEAAGPNCGYGGSKVTSGHDANANNTLDPGEVTATSYNCNGAPGTGITWVHVTGTSAQAEPNKGYLADSASQVVITLPASPAIGDLVQVSGIGSGGWKIAQNAGQSILVQGLPGDKPQAGVDWTTRHLGLSWIGLASSANGSKLVAAADQLYTSTDSGLTWTARDSARQWYGVASSADGSKLVAGDRVGQLYTSTDSGLTWTARDSVRQWFGVASSADGNKLVAADYGGQIYTSTDAGVSWTGRDAVRNWYAVASSADGNRLVAAVYGGQLYTSTDAGVTWTARDAARNWQAVASSADGNKLVAAEDGGQLYTSTDAGVTWTARDSARSWRAVASSADGVKLVAVAFFGKIHTSDDSGVTWTERDFLHFWQSVASSADGNKLAAGGAGAIYTSLGDRTSDGTGGSLTGGQHDAITLQYMGGDLFMPLNHQSYSGGFVAQ
jgi:hypothetical protein